MLHFLWKLEALKQLENSVIMQKFLSQNMKTIHADKHEMQSMALSYVNYSTVVMQQVLYLLKEDGYAP